MEPKTYPIALHPGSYHLPPPDLQSPLIINDIVRMRPPSPLILSRLYAKSPLLIPSQPLLPFPSLISPSRISINQQPLLTTPNYFEQLKVSPPSLRVSQPPIVSTRYQKKLTLQQILIKKKLLNYLSSIIPENPFTTKELINFFDSFLAANFLRTKEKFISGNGSAHLIDSTHPFSDIDLFYVVEIDSTINKNAFLDSVLDSIVKWLHQLLKNKNIHRSMGYIEHEILNNKFKINDEKNCYAQYKFNGIDLLIAVYDPVSNKVLMERSNVNAAFRLCLITNTISCYDLNSYCDREGFELQVYRLKNRLFVVNEPEKVLKLHFRILLAWHYGYQIGKELLLVGLSCLHKELRKSPFAIQQQNFNFNEAHYKEDSNSKLITFLNQCTYIGLEEDYEQKIKSLERNANLYLISSKKGSYPENLMQCALFLKDNPEHAYKLMMLLHVTLFFNFLKNNKNIQCYTSSSEFFNGNFTQRASFSIKINKKTYYLFVPYGPKFILSHLFKYIHEFETDPSFKIIKYPYESLLNSLNLISPFTPNSLKEVSKLIVEPFYFNNIVRFQNSLNSISKTEEKNLGFPFIEISVTKFIHNLKKEALKFSSVPFSFINTLTFLNLYAQEENFVNQRSSSGVQFTFLLRQCYTNKNFSDDSLTALHRLITSEGGNSIGESHVRQALKDLTIQHCMVSVFFKYLKNNPFKSKEALNLTSFFNVIESYFLTAFQREYFITWSQSLYLHYKENKCSLILDTLGKHFDTLFSKGINLKNNPTNSEMKMALNILSAYLDLGKLDHMKSNFNRISLILKVPQFGQTFPLLTISMCQKFANLIFTHKLSKKKEIPFNIGFDLAKNLPSSANSELLSYIIYITKLYHDSNQFQKKYRAQLIELLNAADKLQPIKDWPKYKYQSLIQQLMQTKNALLLRWVCCSIFKTSVDKNEIDQRLINFIKEISSFGDNTLVNEFLKFICKFIEYRNPILNLMLIEYFTKSPQKEMMKIVYSMVSTLSREFKTNLPSYQLRFQILNQLTLFWKKLCLQEKDPQLNLECALFGFLLLSKESLFLYFNMLDVSKPNTWPYSLNSKESILHHFYKGKIPDFFKNLIEIALSSQDQKAFIYSCQKLTQFREFVNHEILYTLLEQYINLPHVKQENSQLFNALNNLLCQLPPEIFRANNHKEKTIFEDTLITFYSLIDNDVRIELNMCFLFVGDKLLSYYLDQLINEVEKKQIDDSLTTSDKKFRETKLNSYVSKSNIQQEQRKAFTSILSKRYGSLSKSQMSTDLLETYNKDCIELFTTDWQKMLALEALYENVCRLRVENTELVVKHFLYVSNQFIPNFIPTGRKIFLLVCNFLDKHACISTDGIPLFRKINNMPLFVQTSDFMNEQEKQHWLDKRKYDVLLFNNLFSAFYHHKYYFTFTPKEFDELNRDLTESYTHFHQTVTWSNRMDLAALFRAHRLFIIHSTFWFLKTGDFYLLELLFNNILEYGEKIPMDFSQELGKLVHMTMAKIIQFSLLVHSSLDLNFSSAEALKAKQFEFNPFANQTPSEVGYSSDTQCLIENKFSKIPKLENGDSSIKLLSFSLLLLEKLSEERKKELAQPEYLKPLFEKVVFFAEQCIKLKNCKTVINKMLIKDAINFILKATRSSVDINLLQRLIKANR